MGLLYKHTDSISCKVHTDIMLQLCYSKYGGDNVGKTSSVSKDKYNRKAYDSFLVRVKAGYKAEIQTHAEAKGKSLNGFITEAITEKIERDKQEEARNA